MNGGHGSTQSLGGIHDGIQLDMRRLNKLVVSEDGATVTIGAGATVYKVVHELFAQGKQTGAYMPSSSCHVSRLKAKILQLPESANASA